MTTIDNGVNVQALLDAREVLKGAPEAAQFTWRASSNWQNGVHSTTTIQNFFGLGEEQQHKTERTFDADHPEVFAADDDGITPIEYLLVGLASCLTAGVASVAQNRGIQVRSVESTVEGNHDIRGILGADTDVRNGFNDVKVTFNIDADASKEDIEALVAQSQKRSAVFDALTNPTDVTVEGRLRARRNRAHTTTVVIGAGHAGLAASHFLSDRSIDHVVLERGEVANSWRRERWDSLRLLTPNWQTRLPGQRYDGPDPDGYMTTAEVVEFIERFAAVARAPVRTAPTVTSVRRATTATRVTTNHGEIRCRTVVIASGACNLPAVPAVSGGHAGVGRAADAVRLPQPRPAARRRRARRRRVGDRRAAGGRAAAVRSAGDARRSASTSGCPAPTAGATCCGGWTPRASGTSATTRSTT